MIAKRLFALVLLATLFPASWAAAAEDWEQFPDGSTGQVTEFKGVGGVAIPAFIRKPSGTGPFPVVVLLHGGTMAKGPRMDSAAR